MFSDLSYYHRMVKHVLSMPLRALQGLINSVLKLGDIQLSCSYYTYIIKRAKSVNIAFKTKTRSTIEHFAIHSTDLKIDGEGEWKIKKHGTDGKRRV